MWKFCGKAQITHSFGQIPRNYTETVPFHKISTPGNYVKSRILLSAVFITKESRHYVYTLIGKLIPLLREFALDLEMIFFFFWLIHLQVNIGTKLSSEWLVVICQSDQLSFWLQSITELYESWSWKGTM